MKDFKNLIKLAETVEMPEKETRHFTGNSVFSFGVVNNRNGKRTSYSAALVKKLGLTNTAELIPVPSDSCIMIAKTFGDVSGAKMTATLTKDDGKKISYTTYPVHAITKLFDLNFEKHSSMSFNEITFDTMDDGTPVALVKIINKYPKEIIND